MKAKSKAKTQFAKDKAAVEKLPEFYLSVSDREIDGNCRGIPYLWELAEDVPIVTGYRAVCVKLVAVEE